MSITLNLKYENNNNTKNQKSVNLNSLGTNNPGQRVTLGQSSLIKLLNISFNNIFFSKDRAQKTNLHLLSTCLGHSFDDETLEM